MTEDEALLAAITPGAMATAVSDAAQYATGVRLRCLETAAHHGGSGKEHVSRAREYAAFALGEAETKPTADPAEPDPKLKGLLVAWNTGLVALVTPDGEELILSQKMFAPGAIEHMVSLLEKERRALLGAVGR